MKIFKYWDYILYFAILAVLIWSGINPYDKFTWRLEVLWMFPALGLLAYFWYRGITFSWLLKITLFIQALIIIHGGHYSYEFAPLGEWMKEFFGFSRNHYDRFGHFIQGFFPAIMYREWFIRKKAVNGRIATELFIFTACMSFSALFEIVEFGAAQIWGAGADAFLGTQGDIWDAQKDMFMCALGVPFSLLIFGKLHYKILAEMTKET